MTNLGLTGVFHHRVKTHGPWQVKQPFSGIWVWRSPLGEYYLVDDTGTRRTTDPAETTCATTGRPLEPARRPTATGDLTTEVWVDRPHLHLVDDHTRHSR
jgi:hypothetical protein